jgi:hypothetical protein
MGKCKKIRVCRNFFYIIFCNDQRSGCARVKDAPTAQNRQERFDCPLLQSVSAISGRDGKPQKAMFENKGSVGGNAAIAQTFFRLHEFDKLFGAPDRHPVGVGAVRKEIRAVSGDFISVRRENRRKRPQAVRRELSQAGSGHRSRHATFPQPGGGRRCRGRAPRSCGVLDWVSDIMAHPIRAKAIPPAAASRTTSQGGAFHAISMTKQASASEKSRMSPIALVKTGE